MRDHVLRAFHRRGKPKSAQRPWSGTSLLPRNISENASNFESLQPLRSNFDWIFYPSPITLLPSCEAVLQPPQWRLQLDATIDFLLQGGFSGACNGISASHKLFAAMMIAIGSVRYRFSAQRNQEQIGVHLAARSWSGQGRLISATE